MAIFLHKFTGDLHNIFGGFRIRVAAQQRHTVANNITHACVAADNSQQRRGDFNITLTGATQGIVGAQTLFVGLGIINDDLHLVIRLLKIGALQKIVG